MSTINIPNWDSSTMTAKIDGTYRIIGLQSATLGDGLEPGKPVPQAGQIGPMGYTRPTFKGDGNYSIKMLAAGWTDLQRYLIGQRGGSSFIEGVNGVKCQLVITLNRDGFLWEAEFKNVQFLTPSFSGLDAPDSREPLTAEVKFTVTNRKLNDIWDWDDTQ
jgi:hypothetical protein